MIVDIEVPDFASLLAPPIEAKEPAVIAHAAVSDIYSEEGDEIEEGELFAVLFNDNGRCEIGAPMTGVLISLPYDKGSTVTWEAVLAKIQTDR